MCRTSCQVHSIRLAAQLHAEQLLCRKLLCAVQDQLASQLPAKPRGAASPQPGRMAAQLRAELEVHKDALRTAQEEVQQLSATLEKANIMIEVCCLEGI